MSITIKAIDETTYTVDGLSVYQDQNQNWVGNPLMTAKQIRAFQLHLKSSEQIAKPPNPLKGA